MVLAGQLKRACSVGLVSAAMASAGIFAVSRARADNGDDARAILKAMSDCREDEGEDEGEDEDEEGESEGRGGERRLLRLLVGSRLLRRRRMRRALLAHLVKEREKEAA